MFFRTSLALSLIPLAFAAPHEHQKQPTIINFAGKHTCPASLRPFHATSSILIPGVTAERVWRELGDFCDVDWQGFEMISISGNCDAQRSLRTYHAADLDLTERLDLIHTPPAHAGHPLIPPFFQSKRRQAPQVYAHGYTMLNRPVIAGADVIRMKSLLKVVGVDGGAKVSWDVVGCSDYPEHLADKLEEVHEGALWAVEARLASDRAGLSLQALEQVMDMA